MPQYSGIWTLGQAAQAIKNQDWAGVPPTVVEYLVVAGGGGGSPSAGYNSGGGGAGGLLQGYVSAPTSGQPFTINVGGGGASSTNGTNSTFVLNAVTIVSATGGGAGALNANNTQQGSSGGSGGGGNYATQGGAGISGQGNAGAAGSGGAPNYNGGGGGGAGTAGLVSGNGGAGIASDITGTRVVYAGGGGGQTNSATSTLGGVGGGGLGGNSGAGSTATPGQANTGGGGGGGGTTNSAGGSGIVVVRYPGNVQYFTGGTLNYSNGHIVHTFYSSGTLAPTAPRLFASPDYQISRSLRFYTSASDNPYVHLSRTPNATGSTQRLTYSCWVKRSGLADYQHFGLTAQTTTGGRDAIRFNSDETIAVFLAEGSAAYISSINFFRDTNAWYHIVVVIDTTQQTSTDRIKIYVNGSQIPTTGTQPTQYYNFIGYNVSGQLHNIGKTTQGNFYPFNGYMAEVNFVDGQALIPQNFGYTEPTTGVWTPLQYTGSYGTNGFYLNFADNSGITTTTLGKDSSGNSNNWTPNNFSVTAGAGNDSLLDTPTNYGVDTGTGGEIRGNYCTLNPLSQGSYVTLSNANLDIAGNTNADSGVAIGTMAVTTGLWYWETTCVTVGGFSYAAFMKYNSGYTSLNNAEAAFVSYGGMYRSNGRTEGSGVSITLATYTTGDIIGVALDMTNGAIYLSKNGTWLNGGVPTSGTSKTGAVWTWTSMAYPIAPAGGGYNGSLNSLNFGQRPFAYTAPTGYKALCTQNLPESAAGKLPGKYFGVATYTGSNTTRPIATGVDMATYGGLLWTKGRDVAVSHFLIDTVRGFTKYLATNSTIAEDTYDFGFTSTSFGVTTTNGSGSFNQFPYNYVAWNWAAGGPAVTNTAGSITSSVSANPAAGFSIVSYAGAQGDTYTIGHGLSIAPNFIITKTRNATGAWAVYYTVNGVNTNWARLDTSDGQGGTGGSLAGGAYVISNTTTLQISSNSYANSGSQMIAYCWTEVAGYSKFGRYVGNGSTDGAFVYCGFKPAFILTKDITTGSFWWEMVDSKRSAYNPSNKTLYANVSDTEYTSSGYDKDLLSNGFKIRGGNGGQNSSGNTYIFAAFAESPLKYARAR